MEHNIVFRIVSGYSQKGLPWVVAFSLLSFFFSCEKDDDSNSRPQTALKVEEYFPNSGKGGTLITIKGEGFSSNLDDNIVEFSGTKATVFSATANELVVLAPENSQSGVIKVSNGGQSVDIGNYVYQDLTISGISPLSGTAGTNIRISGQGFSSLQAPAKVTINGVDAIVVTLLDTLVVAKVPKDTGKGPIKVFVDGKETTGQSFRYQSIDSIKPLSGGAGTKLTISGEGFENDLTKIQVYFNKVQSKVLEVSESKIVVEVPPQVETNKVALVINEQKIVSSDIFTVVPPPILSLVTPLSGPVGSTITLEGVYFSEILEENKVTINGKEIAVESSTSNKLTFTLPANAGSGKLELSVNDQRVAGPIFTNQELSIMNVTPESGLADTQITINGIGFSSDPAQNKVLFNGAEATITAATDTTLTVIAPPDLTTGMLKVETNGMVAQAPKEFRRSGVVTITKDLPFDTRSNLDFQIRVDRAGNIYTHDISKIYKITQGGMISVFADMDSLAVRGLEIYRDTIYVIDGEKLRKIAPDGTISDINTSTFKYYPNTLTADSYGNMYYISNGRIRKIILPEGIIREVEGTSYVRGKSRFAIAQDGTIYFVLKDKPAIARVTMGNEQQNWLGDPDDKGFEDGPVTTARISTDVTALQFNSAGNLLILDAGNYAIREVNMATGIVTTVAKVTRGFADGDLSSAQWEYSPKDMAIDEDGNVYILDVNNTAVRKVILK